MMSPSHASGEDHASAYSVSVVHSGVDVLKRIVGRVSRLSFAQPVLYEHRSRERRFIGVPPIQRTSIRDFQLVGRNPVAADKTKPNEANGKRIGAVKTQLLIEKPVAPVTKRTQ